MSSLKYGYVVEMPSVLSHNQTMKVCDSISVESPSSKLEEEEEEKEESTFYFGVSRRDFITYTQHQQQQQTSSETIQMSRNDFHYSIRRYAC